MRATDIIMKKRGIKIRDKDGKQVLASPTVLSKEEIKFIVDEYTAGRIPDYQMSAFTMAVYFNGMNFEETGALTNAMLHSGDVIELHGKDGLPENEIYVDKHSTGGVGDKISLPLAPIVAVCGVKDPMMSGRALGHTGGTLDKLESIEGYNVNLSESQFRAGIKKDGFAMMGQTPNVAPADKKMYALRDVTATVESVPLITSSILSKKVAEGADALVFDVKYGSGAFMKTIPDCEELATFLVKTAQAMGKKATAFMTDMETPLGYKIGNFLEIEETVECLQGKGPEDVMELTYALGAEMVFLAGKADSPEKARKMCEEAVSSGKALQKFLDNVKTQGGNPEKLMSQIGNRRSPHHTQLVAEKDGYIKINAFATGLAGVYLGVGRNKSDDPVCADAGIILGKRTNDFVKKGDVIMDIYGKDGECLEPSLKKLREAISYSDEKFPENKLIYKIIK